MAAASTRYLRTSLFETSAIDPATFAAVVAILFGVTLAARGLPIARATSIDPAVALRQD